MLKSIREWWNTPMVPKSHFDKMKSCCLESEHEIERLEEMLRDEQDVVCQRNADIDDAKAERDAANLERDKALGKFEYIEKRRLELEKNLAERDSYVKFLEGQLKIKTHLDELDDDDFDDMGDIDDLCDECGMEIQDCDCDIDDDDECEDDETCPCCGNDL